jgi:cysteine desulfurase/selenocysteine lyase
MTHAVDIRENPYKKDFPLLETYPDLAFLDSAATAQRPRAVIDAQADFYRTMNANPLRGLYQLSCKATEGIDIARKSVANFIGAANPDEIVFTRNTSESLNLVAKTLGKTVLGPGDEVLITIMEHHSNLIPWQQVCEETGAKLVYLYPEKDGTLTPEMAAEKINEHTKIVSMCHVSNVLGVVNPVKEIAEIAHKVGAYVVVDAAQSTPHIPVDVQELGCDLLAFSGHKVMGPFGIGVLWGRMDVLKAMPPFLTGGEMIDAVTETSATWAPVPTKFEAGTQDAAGIYATEAALSYLTHVGHEELEAREAALVRYCMERLGELEWVDIYGPEDPDRHKGVVSFNVRGIHPHDVASLLDTKDVAIRAGHHCAQPLLAWMGVESCNRASIAFYNDASDIDKLVDGLKFVWGIFNGNN